MKNRTVIVIAHRLSTIEDADVIFVVKDGRIVQSGTHDELKGEAGIYRELVALSEKNRTFASSPRGCKYCTTASANAARYSVNNSRGGVRVAQNGNKIAKRYCKIIPPRL